MILLARFYQQRLNLTYGLHFFGFSTLYVQVGIFHYTQLQPVTVPVQPHPSSELPDKAMYMMNQCVRLPSCDINCNIHAQYNENLYLSITLQCYRSIFLTKCGCKKKSMYHIKFGAWDWVEIILMDINNVKDNTNLKILWWYPSPKSSFTVPRTQYRTTHLHIVADIEGACAC